MEPDELDKLIAGGKLGNVGADEKVAAGLESLYGASDRYVAGGKGNRLAGVDLGAYKGAMYNGPVATQQVADLLTAAGRALPAALARPYRPTGQVGQLGQLQMQMASPGAPQMFGPQLCRPVAVRSAARQGKRKRKSPKRCSCTH